MTRSAQRIARAATRQPLARSRAVRTCNSVCTPTRCRTPEHGDRAHRTSQSEVRSCMNFKAKQRRLVTSIETQPISLTQSQHCQPSSEAIVMTIEQPWREIKGCQHGLIAGVPVHEQSANNVVYSAFQRSLGNFSRSNVTPNTTTTYPMPKSLLRSNQQCKNMKLALIHFS